MGRQAEAGYLICHGRGKRVMSCHDLACQGDPYLGQQPAEGRRHLGEHEGEAEGGRGLGRRGLASESKLVLVSEPASRPVVFQYLYR